jgi:hypothetical protein
MELMERLERRFGQWAIPHLTLYLIGIQAVGVFLLMGGYINVADLVLVGGLVQVGQWTRLLSFMMIPKTLHPLWLFFAFYIFYLIGTTLEREWGAFRFNLFILTGYLLTVTAAFLVPTAVISNYFFLGAVFLAFATLMPNFEFYLFFILPVKVKWLGWLTAALYFMVLLTGDPGSRLCVLAAFLTYALFFGQGFIGRIRAARRRQAYLNKNAKAAAAPLHVCSRCGISDKSDEALQFRYCSTCGRCFCEKHITDHDH